MIVQVKTVIVTVKTESENSRVTDAKLCGQNELEQAIAEGFRVEAVIQNVSPMNGELTGAMIYTLRREVPEQLSRQLQRVLSTSQVLDSTTTEDSKAMLATVAALKKAGM